MLTLGFAFVCLFFFPTLVCVAQSLVQGWFAALGPSFHAHVCFLPDFSCSPAALPQWLRPRLFLCVLQVKLRHVTASSIYCHFTEVCESAHSRGLCGGERLRYLGQVVRWGWGCHTATCSIYQGLAAWTVISTQEEEKKESDNDRMTWGLNLCNAWLTTCLQSRQFFLSCISHCLKKIREKIQEAECQWTQHLWSEPRLVTWNIYSHNEEEIYWEECQ